MLAGVLLLQHLPQSALITPPVSLSAIALTGKLTGTHDPVVDGDSISAWTDDSENAEDLGQATGANQPTVDKSTDSTLTLVGFSGSQHMTAASGSTVAWLVLIDPGNTTAGRVILAQDTTAAGTTKASFELRID